MTEKQYRIWPLRLIIALLAATLALGAVSCKKDDKKDDPKPNNTNNDPNNPGNQDTSATWRTVRITRLVLEAFPPNKPNGNNWDSPITGIPEPDIFPVIEVDGRKLYDGESARFENVKQSALPIAWNITNFSPVDLSARIRIILYDYDSLESNDEMTSFTFSAINYKPTGTSSTNSYTYNSGGYRLRVEMSFAK